MYLQLSGISLFLLAFLPHRTTQCSGRVLDETRQALQGVTVVAKHLSTSTFRGCVTDENGYFLLKNLRNGDYYQLTLSFTGYKNQTKDSVLIREGHPVEIEFQMLKL